MQLLALIILALGLCSQNGEAVPVHAVTVRIAAWAGGNAELVKQTVQTTTPTAVTVCIP